MTASARPRPRRPAAVLLLLLAGWLLAGVVTAGPAAAHAELVGTDPGEGARLSAVPERVSLDFSEGVSVGAGYLRVLDASGGRVDAGTAEVDDRTVSVALRDGLGEGGYLVTYRVISADSHPIAGSFSFVVGDGELVDASVAGAADDTDPAVAVALPAARWTGFAGLALAVGVPALVALCWPGGWASALLRRLTAVGLAALGVGAALTFALQGPYAAATGLGSVTDGALLSATAGSEIGVMLLVRLALTAGLALLLLPWLRRGTVPAPSALVLAGLLAAGLVVTTAAVGHPVAGPYPAIAVLAATAHVAAMTLWLGGLAALLGAVLRNGVPAAELAAALPRYSRLAAASVGVLVVSGVVQAVREVGSPDALFSTGYGRLLLAKLAVVALLLAAAGVSRVWVQQRLGIRRSRTPRRRVTAHAFAAPAGGEPEPSPEVVSAAAAREEDLAEGAAAERGLLRRSVLVELALGVVVLALSAVLVGTPPARATVSEPVDVTLPLQSAAGEAGSVQISLDPAAPGANTLHVYLFDEGGRLVQPEDIRVTLTEPGQEIGPLAVDLEPAGPGHYVGDGTAIPSAGTWTLAVSVRLDEFTAITASTEFPVR
ncbi:copper resistance CopC family protein [Trujillonella endophytica]|uniref:Copper transport protein n=1 Tax=Trujillonella endophytica TaxID=673521 RepID=A0A1H8UW86_9ACTN|nr:copper resistance CopC family protein [Trujillella endophytica]SEP07237.1 copper transport protein [Trujillella endophytica]